MKIERAWSRRERESKRRTNGGLFSRNVQLPTLNVQRSERGNGTNRTNGTDGTYGNGEAGHRMGFTEGKEWLRCFYP
jgi:hypothetical protein